MPRRTHPSSGDPEETLPISTATEEFLSVVRHWRESRALLRAHVGLRSVAMAFLGRVQVAEAGRLELLSDDGNAEAAFEFAADAVFEFVDAREFEEDAAPLEVGLLIWPHGQLAEPAAKITILELRDATLIRGNLNVRH